MTIARLILCSWVLWALGVCPLLAAEPKASARLAATPWPHEQSDLRPDPAVLWGRLENGFRYAILPRSAPSHRVSLCLLVEAGSYEEHDDELGYAHYVEHMAFRGARDFPGDEIIQRLQRLGLSFGPDINADTSLFQTDYRLENIPTDDAAALATAIKVLRSIADGIRFDARAVKRERGVISSEARARDGTLTHAWRDEMEFLRPSSTEATSGEREVLFGETRLAERLPIGKEKTLDAATPQKLRAFYDRWYRPDRMILSVVGDLTPAAVDALVRKHFVSLRAHDRLPEQPPAGISPATSRSEWPILVSRDLNVPVTEMAICTTLPNDVKDTASRRRKLLVQRLAMGMFDRRLRGLMESSDAPFTTAETYLGHEIPGLELASVRATVKSEHWPQALKALDLEIRRVAKDGFTSPEFSETIAGETLLALTMGRVVAGRQASDISRALAFSVSRHVVFTAADDDEQATLAQLGSVKIDECSAAMRQLFPRDKLSLVVTGPFGKGVPDPAIIPETLSENAVVALTPYSPPAEAKPFPYTHFGPVGQVVAERHSAALDADLIEFSNGVRLNLKRTNFEPKHVRLLVRFGSGNLACPPDKPGLPARVFAWAAGGLNALTSEGEGRALKTLFGDRTLSFTADDFRIGADEEASKLLLLLQSFAAYFVDPAFREEAWPRGLEMSKPVLAPYESTAQGVILNAFNRRMTGGSPAFSFPRIKEVSERTLQEFKAWFGPQLATGALEITMVGDFDRTQAIDEVARTFGALPTRAKDDPYAERRKVLFPPKPFTETVSFDGVQRAGAVCVSWPIPETISTLDTCYGLILGNVLTDRLRLKLRAEKGETYSPSVAFGRFDSLIPISTYLRATIDVAPERAQQVAAATREIAENLARSGIAADEFERARRPMVREVESNLRDNAWWLGVLCSVSRMTPKEMEDQPKIIEMYRTATVEKLNVIARRILVKERECQLTVVPAAPSTETETTAIEYIQRGNQNNEKGDYDGAIAEYDRAIAIDPKIALAYSERASAKQAKGNHDGAMADWDRAFALSPNFSQVYVNRGAAKNGRGDHDGAITDYSRAIALDPNDFVAYNDRGAAEHDKGNDKEAIADFDRAVLLNPQFMIAYFGRGTAERSSGNPAAAIQDFTRWIAGNPKDPDGYDQRAAAENDKGDADAAFADWNKTLALNPSNAFAYANRATIEAKRGDLKAALADYDRAILLDPKQMAAFANRAVIEIALGEYAEAIADNNRAIKLNPSEAQRFAIHGEAKELKKDYTGAFADYDLANASDPKKATTFFDRGHAEMIMENQEKAIEDFDQSRARAPNNAGGYKQRAAAEKVLHDNAQLNELNKKLVEGCIDQAEMKRKRGDEAGARADEALAEQVKSEQK